MLREILCFVAGAAILLANTLDIAWTTLGTHGGGPICGPTLSLFWKVAVGLHKRRKHHRLLSFIGSALLLVLLVLWTGLIWLGWFTIFTFLLNVLGAVVGQRSLAAYIADLGGKPLKILERSWTGEHFDSLSDHLVAVTAMVQMYAEQHLAYPVLHFFHSESERTSTPLQLAALEELVFLLCHADACSPDWWTTTAPTGRRRPEPTRRKCWTPRLRRATLPYVIPTWNPLTPI